MEEQLVRLTSDYHLITDMSPLNRSVILSRGYCLLQSSYLLPLSSTLLSSVNSLP